MPATKTRPTAKKSAPPPPVVEVVKPANSATVAEWEDPQFQALLRLTVGLKWDGDRVSFLLGDRALPVFHVRHTALKILRSHYRESPSALVSFYPCHHHAGYLIFQAVRVEKPREIEPEDAARFIGILDPRRAGELLVCPKGRPSFGLQIEGLDPVAKRGRYRLPAVLLTPAMRLRAIAEPELLEVL